MKFDQDSGRSDLNSEPSGRTGSSMESKTNPFFKQVSRNMLIGAPLLAPAPVRHLREHLPVVQRLGRRRIGVYIALFNL